MIDQVKNPGKELYSPAERIGELLKERFTKDPSFYLFSPDETTSNRLDAAYETAERAWAMPQKEWDLKESESGRIVELLSENTLFAMMVGHILNNEQAMMTSYESFFSIITSQLVQHCKFIEQSESTTFRPHYPAANLLSTSTCWRQDHNGFSHQSPILISTVLSRPDNLTNCLFPVDDVAAEEAINFMFDSTDVVNITTFNKNKEPRWIDSHHAKFQYENGGASIFEFASDKDPDYIFTAAGDIATREALKAIEIIREDLPKLRVRFVGVTALSYNAIGTTKNKLGQDTFDGYFTTDKPIIANFHGYADTFKNILIQYADKGRIFAHGFNDQGSTTTPFEMLSLNGASRYHLALDIAYAENNQKLIKKYQDILSENHAFATRTGEDLVQIYK